MIKSSGKTVQFIFPENYTVCKRDVKKQTHFKFFIIVKADKNRKIYLKNRRKKNIFLCQNEN